jgi:hypothetical protein
MAKGRDRRVRLKLAGGRPISDLEFAAGPIAGGCRVFLAQLTQGTQRLLPGLVEVCDLDAHAVGDGPVRSNNVKVAPHGW